MVHDSHRLSMLDAFNAEFNTLLTNNWFVATDLKNVAPCVIFLSPTKSMQHLYHLFFMKSGEKPVQKNLQADRQRLTPV